MMVSAAKLLLCVLEMHVFRVFCVPVYGAGTLDTVLRQELARFGPKCVELS